jgi:hypothetical protein
MKDGESVSELMLVAGEGTVCSLGLFGKWPFLYYIGSESFSYV